MRRAVKSMIYGHPVTTVLRWMGANGWSYSDANTVLNHFITDVSPVTVSLCLRNPNGGKVAPLTRTQQMALIAIRDGKPVPHVPSADTPSAKMDVFIRNAVNDFEAAVAADDVPAIQKHKIVLDALLQFLESSRADVQHALTTGDAAIIKKLSAP